MHIYADNAATTKLDSDSFASMEPFLREEYGNPSQPYSLAVVCKKAINEARKTIAECINAEPEEIYFTSGGTEGDNWAIKNGSALYGNVLTSAIEHHAVLNSCKSLEIKGVTVSYLPVNQKGLVIPEGLARLLKNRPALCSIMSANNEIGTIEPIEELAHIAHKHNSIFHTDAVQAVGHIPIDVKALDVDILSASGHKFYGPKGVGFQYIRRGVKIAPYIDGGAQQSGYRAGTENVAGIVGMATALRKSCNLMPAEIKRLQRMEKLFFDILSGSNLDYIRNGAENHLPGSINISVRDANGEMLLHRLDLMGICISTGSACDSTETQISHVIKSIGVPVEYSAGTIRVTFGRNNNDSDAMEVARAILRVLSL